jgi:hypothetical protein
MPKHRIFIGSSNESKEALAVPVAQQLSDAGFEVIRWWKAFRPGDINLERLRALAGDVDGAVLLCRGIDRLWYRGQSSDVPRDNVIFELGLFIQSLGSGRAIVVADAQVKLPSDLAGLTHLEDTSDADTVAERVVDHFRRILVNTPADAPTGLNAIPIEVDPDVAEKCIRQQHPSRWHQRSLYAGSEGARAWMAVSEENEAQRPADEDALRTLILQTVRGLAVRSFISLGPGDGEVDREIIITIRDSSLSYLPIDISEGLLFNACRIMAEHAHVPLGLLTDFEDRLPFIKRRLATLKKTPTLVGLLGNTFGNLDVYEATFLRQLELWLQPGDLILLQVGTIDDTATTVDAPIAARNHSDARRRFFAHGLARHSNVSIDSVLQNYDRRVTNREGRSDVPSTISVDFVDAETGWKIQNLRWYRWPILLDWITSNFAFTIRKGQAYNYQGKERGMGVALLERI